MELAVGIYYSSAIAIFGYLTILIPSTFLASYGFNLEAVDSTGRVSWMKLPSIVQISSLTCIVTSPKVYSEVLKANVCKCRSYTGFEEGS